MNALGWCCLGWALLATCLWLWWARRLIRCESELSDAWYLARGDTVHWTALRPSAPGQYRGEYRGTDFRLSIRGDGHGVWGASLEIPPGQEYARRDGHSGGVKNNLTPILWWLKDTIRAREKSE